MTSTVADEAGLADLRASTSTKDLAGRWDDEGAVGVVRAVEFVVQRIEMTAFSSG